MSLGTLQLILSMLTMIADVVPKIAPGIRDLFQMLKGVPVVDITQEELEMRVDAAVGKLKVWE